MQMLSNIYQSNSKKLVSQHATIAQLRARSLGTRREKVLIAASVSQVFAKEMAGAAANSSARDFLHVRIPARDTQLVAKTVVKVGGKVACVVKFLCV